jgi:hypothetical protein
VGRASSGTHLRDPSPETSTRDARARAWLYAFECYERKKAFAGSTARTRNEAKGENDVCGEIGTQG